MKVPCDIKSRSGKSQITYPAGPVYLGGGEDGDYTADRYLDFYDGAQMSGDNGYCMPRAGFITGVSCSVQVSVKTTTGDVICEVRKNGTAVFSVTKEISATGDYNFSATQGYSIDTFTADDVLTLYMNFDGFVGTLHDTCVLMEVMF